MCVGCSRGFEIVDLESLDTQGLLDLNDESLEFVREWENLLPMVIYCILDEYLLCYDGEFLFPLFFLNEFIFIYFSFQKSLHFMLIRKVGGHGKISWCIGKAHRRGLVSLIISLLKDFLILIDLHHSPP